MDLDSPHNIVDSSRIQSTKKSIFRFSHVIVLLIFFSTFIEKLIHAPLSITIRAMVNKTAFENPVDALESDNSSLDGSCPLTNNSTHQQDFAEGSLLWNNEEQGLILSAFSYAYPVSALVSGRLNELFGPKLMMGGGILMASALTLLLPIVSGLGVTAMVILRLLTGICHGPLLPGIVVMISRWTSDDERTRTICVCMAGKYISAVITMPVTAWLCTQDIAGGWPSVFYLFGLCGITWTSLWLIFSSNHPSESLWISREERSSLTSTIRTSKAKVSAPWKSILTSVPVWAFVLSHITTSWIENTCSNSLSSFLDEVFHVPIKTNGLINALVNGLAIVFSLLSGYFSDLVLNRRLLSRTNTRKLLRVVGSIGCALGFFLVTRSACDKPVAIFWICFCYSFESISHSTQGPLVVDMAPNFSGSLLSLASSAGSLIALSSPIVTGKISSLENLPMTTRWEYIFDISICLSLIGAAISFVFWSAEVQPWNTIDEEENEVLCDSDQLASNDRTC